MLDTYWRLLSRGGYLPTILLLLILLVVTACSAVDPVQETPASTSSILIPLVEQADSVPDERSAVASPASTEETASERAGTDQPGGENAALPEMNCTSPAMLTPPLAEGPYYSPDTPERTSLLEADIDGTRLILTGYVLAQDCRPIPGAWLDFWQTDAQGEYDNAGYRLRGHQFTDANGRYLLETIIPGEYPGRPQHIHVKVQAPGAPVLTTQLYFPNSTGNESDPLFSSANLLSLQEFEDGFISTFNFVVEE